MHPCLICGMADEEKPMCFRRTDWCCENHRKQLLALRWGEDADVRSHLSTS